MMSATAIGHYRAPYGAALVTGSSQVIARRIISPVGAGPYRAPHGPFFLKCITEKWAACSAAYSRDAYRQNICKKTSTLGCASQVDKLVDAEKAAEAAKQRTALRAAQGQTRAAQGEAQAAQARVAELENELAAALSITVQACPPPLVETALPPLVTEEPPKEGMSTTTKILIGVGGVAVIGGGIYFMTR